MPNRLAQETSPYLLQHADNPVEWMPWGPEALALGAHLNKQVGLSLGQTSQVLQLGFGLQVSRAGIYRALARMAERAAPTYEQLIVTARHSLVNWMDETGWRVGGRSQWLWVAVSEAVTV